MQQSVRRFDSITVFGGATLDHVSRSSAPPVMGASNPGTTQRLAGGVGFNVATVLSRLGLPTRMVTAVGADDAGATIVNAAKDAGIDTAAIAIVKGSSTAGYHATFDDRGNLIIGIADMKICDAITPAAVAPGISASEEHDFWVVDANLPAPTLAFLAAEAQNARRPIAALTVSPAKAVRLIPILESLSYVFTNRKEAAALSGRDPDDNGATVAKLAVAVAGHRNTSVVVTNGGEPLAVASNGECRSFAPLKAAVTGVNGAGDSLAAGTILALADGHGLHDAVRFGLAAAALALEAGSISATSFTPDALAERLAGRLGRERAVS